MRIRLHPLLRQRMIVFLFTPQKAARLQKRYKAIL